ncbi:MAG: non-ribosomal peptide synthetase, partial [Hymenobacter sp.]
MTALHSSLAIETIDFDPFAGSELTLLVPLSAAQTELWLACQLGGDDASRAYNESVSLRLRGPLRVPALRAALAALARRHEALRATCSADGRLLCVLAELPVELAYDDLAAQAGPDGWQAQAVATYAGQQAQHVFDLVHGPLWQAGLLRLAEHEYHFTLTTHHLICDGWSLGVLLHDLSQLYGQALGGGPVLAPATPFSEYVGQEAAWAASAAYEQTAAFWRNAFADGGPALPRLLEAALPAARSYHSRRLDLPLDPALVAGLRALGTAAGCSFVATLLAVFEALLHRLTGQDDLVVGLPTAGQAALGLPTVVGHCVSLLPLRSRPQGALPFLDYLRTRKTELLDALEHQQLSYGRLLAQLPRRSHEPGRPPLVAVVFNVDLGLDDGVAFEGLTHELISNPRAFENFELSLNASGRGNALVLECAYNTALFQVERIEQLLAGFVRVAQQVVAQPTTRLADLLPALPPLPAAYQQLNATRAAFPAATLHELVAAQARATPAAVAVRLGSTALTYAELDCRASQLAAALRPQLPAGTVAGVAVERGPNLLVALLAVLKCGAAYLPLDPAYPAERLAFMLADSGARLLLASAGSLPTLLTPTPRLVLEELLAEATPPPDLSEAVLTTGADLCYLLYTSGSTGQPKGVAVTHRNVVNLLTSLRREPGLTATDRLLAITTISFDIAVLELFLPLLCGGTVILADAYT